MSSVNPVVVIMIVLISVVVIGVGGLFWKSESGLRKIAALPPEWTWHGLPLLASEEIWEEKVEDNDTTTLSATFEGLPITPIARWFKANWPPPGLTMYPHKITPTFAQYVLLPNGQTMDDEHATPVVLGLTGMRQTPYGPRSVHVIITDARSLSRSPA
jgi:hypothetical protein